MKLCRFKDFSGTVCVGLAIDENTMANLTAGGVESITSVLEDADGMQRLSDLAVQDLPKVALADVTLLTPVEGQEIWA